MFEKQSSHWQSESTATDWCHSHKKFTQIVKCWRTDHKKHNETEKQRFSLKFTAELCVSTVYFLNARHTVEVIL